MELHGNEKNFNLDFKKSFHEWRDDHPSLQVARSTKNTNYDANIINNEI